jgi:hypothetical protein
VASQSFGSVESYRNSLFILLFDKKESFNPYEKTGFNNYISTKITKDVGNVYTYPIDVSTQSASELAKQLSNRDEKSIYA